MKLLTGRVNRVGQDIPLMGGNYIRSPNYRRHDVALRRNEYSWFVVAQDQTKREQA